MNEQFYQIDADQREADLHEAVEAMRELVWRRIRSLPPEFLKPKLEELEALMTDDERRGLARGGANPVLNGSEAKRYSYHLVNEYLRTIPLSKEGEWMHAQTHDATMTTSATIEASTDDGQHLIRLCRDISQHIDTVDRVSALIDQGSISMARTILLESQTALSYEISQLKSGFARGSTAANAASNIYHALAERRVRDGGTLATIIHDKIGRLNTKIDDATYRLERASPRNG